MGAVKQIDGVVVKTLNGRERKFALNMRALCTLEDELFENPRSQKKLENAILQENRTLRARIEYLEAKLKEAKVEFEAEVSAPSLFLGLLDLNRMSNAETVTLVHACLSTNHPDLKREELVDEMGTLERSREYVEAVLEAIVASQGISKDEAQSPSEEQATKKGKSQG